MKEKPTTFQLAQLAAQASTPITGPKDAVKRAWDLWREAEAEIAEHDNRAEYLRNLFWTDNGKDIPIFTDSPEDWQARLKGYPGDAGAVDKALWDHEFRNDEVQKQLYKDKTLSRNQRNTLFLGLAKACIIYDMEGPPVPYGGKLNYLEGGTFIAPREGFPIHPKNRERAEENHHGMGEMLIPSSEVNFVEQVQALLSKPKLYAHLVRWAAEVRLRQLAAAKTRLIPESVKSSRREHNADDSIQFKRTFRQ